MVKYKTILKIMEQETNKCHVPLKTIREKISPILKKITDNTQEYNDLMEIIPKFYRNYKNHSKEYIEITCFNGKKFEYEGDEDGVTIPNDIIWYSQEESGIMYTIHTHGKGNSSYQSIGDYQMMLDKTYEKYLMTVGADGIIISKDTTENWSNTRTQNCNKAWDENQINIENKLLEDKKLKKEFDKITKMERNIENYSDEEYFEELKKYKDLGNKTLNKHLKNNIGEEVENLNSLYEKYDVGITITHIPI